MSDPFRHGTITGYTRHKCRCDDCKAAKAEQNRRRPSRSQKNRITRSAPLPVTCWCEAAIVNVPAADIRAGVTGSCGSGRCEQVVA